MTPIPLRLELKELHPKVGLAEYDILFAYFVVKSKIKRCSIVYDYILNRHTVYENLAIVKSY